MNIYVKPKYELLAFAVKNGCYNALLKGDEEYIVAWDYNIENGEWEYGHHFEAYYNVRGCDNYAETYHTYSMEECEKDARRLFVKDYI